MVAATGSGLRNARPALLVTLGSRPPSERSGSLLPIADRGIHFAARALRNSPENRHTELFALLAPASTRSTPTNSGHYDSFRRRLTESLPKWQEVTLIFSAPVNPSSGASPEKAWVVFLTTDIEASVEKTLSIYALRWSVEVYFKEAKQNFGLLAEQSGAYQYAYASVHLATMRYALIFEAMLRSGRLSYGEVRDRQTGHLRVLCFAGLLWQLFRSLIEGALDALADTFGKETLDRILEAIDSEVEDFLNRALHMDPGSLESDQCAEALGIDWRKALELSVRCE